MTNFRVFYSDGVKVDVNATTPQATSIRPGLINKIKVVKDNKSNG